MITPEDLPHFVTGQHDRVGSLAFLRSNNSILTCLYYLWLSLVEKMFGLLALFLAFLSSAMNVIFRYRFLYNLIRKNKFKPYSDQGRSKAFSLFFFGGGGIRVTHFCLIFKGYLKFLECENIYNF